MSKSINSLFDIIKGHAHIQTLDDAITAPHQPIITISAKNDHNLLILRIFQSREGKKRKRHANKSFLRYFLKRDP